MSSFERDLDLRPWHAAVAGMTREPLGRVLLMDAQDETGFPASRTESLRKEREQLQSLIVRKMRKSRRWVTAQAIGLLIWAGAFCGFIGAMAWPNLPDVSRWPLLDAIHTSVGRFFSALFAVAPPVVSLVYGLIGLWLCVSLVVLMLDAFRERTLRRQGCRFKPIGRLSHGVAFRLAIAALLWLAVPPAYQIAIGQHAVANTAFSSLTSYASTAFGWLFDHAISLLHYIDEE